MSRYYDDYIAHSKGPWKKHKYLSKVGEGADAKYIYAGGVNKSTDNNGNDIKIIADGVKRQLRAEKQLNDAMNQHASNAARRMDQANRNYVYQYGDERQKEQMFKLDAKSAQRYARKKKAERNAKKIASSAKKAYKTFKKSKGLKVAKAIGKGVGTGAVAIGGGIVGAGVAAGSAANKVNKFLSGTSLSKNAKKQMHNMQSGAKKQIAKTNREIKKSAAKTANNAGKRYVSYNRKRSRKITNRAQQHSQKMTNAIYGTNRKK